MQVRGVVFDLDGTLVSQELDFEAIRREIGLPPKTPLLEALAAFEGAKLQQARQILDRHEAKAAATARLHNGVVEFLHWLDSRNVRRAILSRNSRQSIEVVLARLGLSFDAVLGREDAPHKPSPQGLWQICKGWELSPEEVLMIGDYLFDLQAGKNAGTKTALVTHGRDLPFAELADVIFPNFAALPEFPPGWFAKLP